MTQFRAAPPAPFIASLMLVAPALLLLSEPALAHPGAHMPEENPWMQGLLHPLLGLDHLLAFAGFGLYLGLAQGNASLSGVARPLAQFAAAFAGGLTFGWLAGSSGEALTTLAELFSHATAIVIGLLLVFGLTANGRAHQLVLPLVALTALGHGYLFAAAMSGPEAGFGLMAASSTLVALGFVLGQGAARHERLTRRPIGAALALFGSLAGLMTLYG